MSLTGKVIVVTGGSSGIGLETTKLLLAQGAIVCVGDIQELCLPTELKSIPNVGSVSYRRVNVSVRKDVDDWVASVIKDFGQIHGAANCAGTIGRFHGICNVTDIQDEEWDALLATNLTGLMYCLRAELRVISDHGSIVNVASVQGVMGFAQHAAYSTTKHGVLGLSRSAAKEVGHRGIRVNAVCPGTIQTPMLDKFHEISGKVTGNEEEVNALKRQGQAVEVARTIVFLLSSDSSYTTGATVMVDGGWNC